MQTTRIGILAVAALGIAPLLNAQYVRIADVDAIANGVSPPTVLESAFAPTPRKRVRMALKVR